MEWWLAYLAIGAVAGLLAGVLGVGGGIVVVPAMAMVLQAQGVAKGYILPLALGTSLATIIFTSFASLAAHHARAAVDWSIVRRLSPGLVIGALVGASLATRLSSIAVTTVYAAFLWMVATHLVVDRHPPQSKGFPGWLGWSLAGGVIGGVSGVVGIGGGTLSVPFLTWCRVSFHKAIGTSAAAGFFIAMAGALGYGANGPGLGELPRFSLGFVYVPAAAGVALASVVMAPVGASLAHRLPTSRLRIAFAVFLYLVGARMLYPLWAS